VRRALGLAILVTIVAGCGIQSSTRSSHLAAAPAGKDVNLALRRSDLPSGYSLSYARRWGNGAAATRDSLPVAVYRQHGRIVSYETAYQQKGMLGLLAVDDSVASYATPDGAHWVLRRNQTETLHRRYHGKLYHQVAMRRVGDESYAYAVVARVHGYLYTLNIILFRQGSYMGYLLGGGLTGSFKLSQLVHLAQTMAGRARTV